MSQTMQAIEQDIEESEKRERSHEDILASAARLLREKGVAGARVADVMADDFQTIPASMKLNALVEGIARHDPLVARRQASLILDASGNLEGMITRGDIVRAAASAVHRRVESLRR